MSESASVGGFQHVHEWLSEYLDGGLPDSDRQMVEAHLGQCAECRRDFESLRLTVQLVRQVPLQRVPRSFTIAAPPNRQAWQVAWLRWSSGVLAAAFVALLALRFVLPGTLQPAVAPSFETAASTAQRSIAAAPTTAPAAAARPVSPGVANQSAASAAPSLAAPAAAPTEALRPLAAAQAQGASAAPTPVPAAADANASAPAQSQPAPMMASAPTATPAGAAEKAVAPAAGQVADQRDTGVASSAAAPTSPPVVGFRPLSAETAPLASAQRGSLPGWYTPLLVVVGVLLVGSLGGLIWLSRRA